MAKKKRIATTDDLPISLTPIHDSYHPSRDGTRCVYGYFYDPAAQMLP